ncbi:MAG: hypothetical protein ABW048_09230, partial [Sphingobium sp.]
GPINFQNAGTTATFQRSGGQDFAVLNRIIPGDPSRPVVFNGNVYGRVGSGFSQTGGSVYFYSPGGIILGSTARFDVGQLGLTTAPPVYATNGTFITGGQVVYGAAAQGTAVDINAGAIITAPVDGASYVALFAPIISQNGTINANGSTALVAASAGQLTWNNGLFTIQATVGTDGDGSGQAIVHGGTTGGTVPSGGVGDPQRVYIVAVPRNTAVTTLIQGGSSLGFNVASAAATDGNAIILSSGFDVVGDQFVSSAGAGTGGNTIIVNNSLFRNATAIKSAGLATIRATGSGVTTFGTDLSVQAFAHAVLQADGPGSDLGIGGDLFIRGNLGESASAFDGGQITFSAVNGGFVRVGGSVQIDASVTDTSQFSSSNATGGQIELSAALDGTMEIDGNLSISAIGTGKDSEDDSAGFGQGGSAQIFASGGNATLSVGGTMLVDASGIGGRGGTGNPGGDGTGGQIQLFTDTATNNRILIASNTTLAANGAGGTGDQSIAGSGTGGIVEVGASSAGVMSFGGLSLFADGRSGDLVTSDTVGSATGGQASLLVNSAGAAVTVTQGLTISAAGRYLYGDAPVTGAGLTQGGTAALSASAGSLTVTGATAVIADAQGDVSSLTTPSGGGATGGFALVSATGTGLLALDGGITLSAGGAAGAGLTGGLVAAGQGGTATLTTDDSGTITAGFVTANASGIGGSGDALSGGAGLGGTASVGQSGASTITIAGDLQLAADGIGHDSAANGVSTSGAGEGGGASVYALGSGTVQIDGGAFLSARGFAGDAVGGTANGAAGKGGEASIGAAGTGTIRLGGAIDIDASGRGGSAFGLGAAGAGTGGLAILGAQAVGAQLIASAQNATTSISANGDGGSASDVQTGGAGTGGNAGIVATGGNTSIAHGVNISAIGTGGGSLDGVAGRGKGGVATLFATTGGTLDISGPPSGTSITLEASGIGGGAAGLGVGGSAESGMAETQALSGAIITLTGSATYASQAVGGDGVNGGSAIGNAVAGQNAVTIIANGGRFTTIGGLTLLADATGGDALDSAGIGGFARGGTISVTVAAGAAADSAIAANALTASARGLGGAGATAFSFGAFTGGAGGAATGGRIIALGQGGGTSAATTSGLLTTGDMSLSVNAIGGNGGDGGFGGGGDLGGAGGAATGGSVRFGADSIIGTNDTGGALFGNVTVNAGAVGGTGGIGGTDDSNQTGLGGVGGAALTGANRTQFIADGARVEAGTVDVNLLALGGSGGNGAVGGDATTGGMDVIVNGRSGGTAIRGALDITSLLATSDAIGGGGSVNGASFYGNGSVLSANGGDVTTGDFALRMGGTQPLNGVTASRLYLRNASFDGTGAFEISTPGLLSVLTDNGQLNADSILLSGNDFVVDPAAAMGFVPGLLSAAGGISVSSANSIILSSSLSAGGDLALLAPGPISAFDLTAVGDLSAESGASVSLRNLSAGGLIDVDALTTMSFGTAVAGGGVALEAGGSVLTGAIDAGDNVVVQSGGSATISGPVTAGIVNPTNDPNAKYTIGIYAADTVQTGALSARGGVGLISGAGSLTAGQIISGDTILLLSGGAVTVGGVTTPTGAARNLYIGNSSVLSSLPGTDFDPTPILAMAPVALSGPLSINGPVTTGLMRFASTGAVTLGAVTTGSALSGSGGAITAGAVTTAGPVQLTSSTGGITLASLAAQGDATLTSAGALAVAGPLSAAALTASGSAITAGAVTATGPAQLTSPGSVSLASFAAQGNGILTSGAALTVTGATSAAALTFTSGGAAKLGSVTVTGALNGSGSSITAGAISAGLQLNLVSPGAISVGPLTGLGDIAVNGGGDIQLGTVTAGDSIFVRAGGAATLLNGSAGLVNPTTVQGGLTREIRVEANGNIVAGTLAAARDVALISNNGAIVGGAVAGVPSSIPSSITSGEDVLLLARTGASLGSISNTGGRTLIANSAMATFGTATNSDPIFTSTTPIAMTGAAAISGPVTTGALTVLAQYGISVAGVTASQRTVLAAANGPLALSGNVLSPQIQFISNDISIGGQINAGRAGNITIFSTNATGMRVGNATTGGGYVLDNSEFIRINSGFLTVGGIDSQSAAIDMTIGDLSMTGPLSGSTIDAPNGIVRFFTGNPQTGQNSGVIRVTGSVRGF